MWKIGQKRKKALFQPAQKEKVKNRKTERWRHWLRTMFFFIIDRPSSHADGSRDGERTTWPTKAALEKHSLITPQSVGGVWRKVGHPANSYRRFVSFTGWGRGGRRFGVSKYLAWAQPERPRLLPGASSLTDAAPRTSKHSCFMEWLGGKRNACGNKLNISLEI